MSIHIYVSKNMKKFSEEEIKVWKAQNNLKILNEKENTQNYGGEIFIENKFVYQFT